MKRLKLYHFENRYGQTHYTSKNIYTSEQNIENTLTLPREIITFFDNHSNKTNDSKKTQNTRFRMPHAQFLTHLSNLFTSIELFGEHCDYLAEKFKYSLKQVPKKSFYLIFYLTEVNQQECLAILTMEARNGIQVNDNEFNILTEILPDKDSRLRKAAIVFKEDSLKFMNGMETNGDEADVADNNVFIRHATLIDSQSTKDDVAISEYFFADFLDSEVVADTPTAISKILLDVIPSTVSPFLRNGKFVKDVKKHIRTKFSNETTSSFEELIHGMTDMFSSQLLNKENMDLDSLSELAYSNAQLKNKTITKRFTAKVIRAPKTIMKDIKDSGKSFKLTISKKSIDNNDAFIDSNTDEIFHIIKVKKRLVRITEQN